jgi:hypothetical protein
MGLRPANILPANKGFAHPTYEATSTGAGNQAASSALKLEPSPCQRHSRRRAIPNRPVESTPHDVAVMEMKTARR